MTYSEEEDCRDQTAHRHGKLVLEPRFADSLPQISDLNNETARIRPKPWNPTNEDKEAANSWVARLLIHYTAPNPG